MSEVPFVSLFRWELRQLAHSKLMWLTGVIVGVVFILGAQSGAALHGAQKEAQAHAQSREQAWIEELEARAAKYRRVSATPLPYWQDPTDVAGFSQYFLLKHSFKPHLPLSPLAVGLSDLLPDRQRIRLTTLFGTNEAYDFQNPRGLALGRFDLTFAVTTLLPVAIILLTVLLCTYERDSGMLRMIAAQPVSPRRWFAARLTSLAVLMLPMLALLFTLALVLASVSPGSALPEFGAALAILLLYAMFWLSLSGFVLSAWPRASGALAVLCGVWLALIVAIPLLANSASTLRPPAITAAQEVEAKRTITDQVQQERDEIVAAGFRAQPLLSRVTDQMSKIDYATRQTFLVPELEARLRFVQEAKADAREWEERVSRWTQWLAPNLGVASSFAVLAGTDSQRHRVFEAQSRQYQLDLRSFFYPLLYREVLAPTPQKAYGRFSFTAFDSIPRFEMRDSGAAERLYASLPSLVWLLVLGSAFVVASMTRLNRWPETYPARSPWP